MNRPLTAAGMMLAAEPVSVVVPVDLVAGAELLTEQPDGHVGDGHGVLCVDALPGGGRGMGGRPLKWTSKCETARQVASRRSPTRGAPSWPGARRRRRRARAGRSSRLHPLRPGSDDLDGEAELVCLVPECEGRSERAGGDDVVPAGVADAGQRVVLSADRQHQVAMATARREGGGKLAHTLVDVEAVLLKGAGQERRRVVLLERRLGVGVDGMADGPYLARAASSDVRVASLAEAASTDTSLRVLTR